MTKSNARDNSNFIRILQNLYMKKNQASISGSRCHQVCVSNACRVFPNLQIKSLCFLLCPPPPLLSLGTTEKNVVLASFFPPTRNLYTLIKSPWAFSSLHWTLLSASPGSLHMTSNVFSIFAGHASVCLGSPELDRALKCDVTSAELEGSC